MKKGLTRVILIALWLIEAVAIGLFLYRYHQYVTVSKVSSSLPTSQGIGIGVATSHDSAMYWLRIAITVALVLLAAYAWLRWRRR